jgi:serine/threonine protein kinase
MVPKITDFGFKSLKENASIFLKYKNKNAYSSPELLKDKKRIGNFYYGLDFHTDVYSYGVLLWEIFTMTIPFNVRMKTIYNMVAVENFRPEIPKELNAGVANIIRNCWDVDINKRPNFTKICELLNFIKI